MITQEFLEAVMTRKEKEFPRGTPKNPHLVRAKPGQNTVSFSFPIPMLEIRPFGIPPYVGMFLHTRSVALQFSAIKAKITVDDIVLDPEIKLFHAQETNCIIVIQEEEQVIEGLAYDIGILPLSGALMNAEGLIPKEAK